MTSAAQVFEFLGYKAGTTNPIAERAGVSVGTLYQYFPSKEALAVALLERHIHDTSRQLHEWVGHMVSKRLAGLLRLHPEGRRENLERAAYFVIHARESLTHRFSAHPDEQRMGKDDFIAELVAMLQGYLTSASDAEAG